MWLSLVEHSVRDAGAGGSNPLIPTSFTIILLISSVINIDFSGYTIQFNLN